MATFAYDFSGAPALEMDFPLIDDTYATGEFLACGVTDGTNLGALKSAAGIYDNMVGILCDAAQTTTGTHAGKNIDEGRVIYNPSGVYRTEHIQGTTAISVAAYSSPPALTFSCTSGKGYPNAGGGWVYVTVDPFKGSLCYVASSAVSTTTCTVTLAVTPGTLTSSSDIIIIPPPFSDGYAVDLTDVGIDGSDIDAPATPGTTGLAIGVMDNWIVKTSGVMERLRANKHEGLSNLDSLGVKFYTDITLAPSHFLLA